MSADKFAWQTHAECLTKEPELFFPAGADTFAVRQTEAAKKVCRTCPVSADCLAWALDTDQQYGVWGGMSEDERRELTRRQDNARLAAARRRSRLPSQEEQLPLEVSA